MGVDTTEKNSYYIHFGTTKAAVKGLVEMKRLWEEGINVLKG